MRDLIDLVENVLSNRIWYHGGDREFTSFDSAEVGSRMGRGAPGFWFTDNPELTGFYGHIQYKVRLHFNEPKIITQEEWESLPSGRSPSLQAVYAARDDYDALIIEGIIDGDTESTVCCVFDAENIEIIGQTILSEESGYDEQTIFMKVEDRIMEIYGADGYGWYADKKDVQLWNRDVKEYRRSERLRNVEPEAHEPVPMKTMPSKNKSYVYLYKPDSSPVTRNWLTMNGAFLSGDGDE